MSALANTRLCKVRGCGSRIHGNGLCRVHYDERRYLRSTGRDPEVRAAWDERREALMQEYSDRSVPGLRPWAWWHFVAERPHHVIGYADYRKSCEGKSIEGQANLYDEYVMERLLCLASIGELREDELAKLKARAEEARPRIGTGHERVGSGGVDRADRRRVKLWNGVRAAMARRDYSTRPAASSAPSLDGKAA